ncbi:hypothetical protein KDA11_04015, partial [Candidatus Saccharibacteria bacterium]|nr:hypothetical protein [Candidatus Saccharibacteria bacterium]
ERRLREYVAQSKELSDAYLEDMILDTQTAIEMGDFLDKLGLEELMCCRAELLTTVLMKQYHE